VAQGNAGSPAGRAHRLEVVQAATWVRAGAPNDPRGDWDRQERGREAAPAARSRAALRSRQERILGAGDAGAVR
jgi:hypothetical protein